MYRRYYQGYDFDNQIPQRPMSQNNENEDSENTVEPQSSKASDTIMDHSMEPEIITPLKPQDYEPEEKKPFPPLPLSDSHPASQDDNKTTKFFGRFGKDDFILLALILIFLIDGVEDQLLFLILVFLFIAGLNI